MHPEICRIGPFTVYSYGLLLVIAFAVVVKLASAQAKKEGVDPEAIFNLLFIAFIFGVIGARIFYVVENLSDYLSNPREILMFTHGGLSWFGGLILGIVSGVIYLKYKRINTYKAMDLIAPFIALGQAIGRLGCFLNGCCYGKEADFGIYAPAAKAVLIPTQIYSSLALLLIFLILRHLQARPHKQSQIFYAYLFLYSIKRFLIEFWRADNQIIFFKLTLFQLISILIFVFSFYKLAVILKKK